MIIEGQSALDSAKAILVNDKVEVFQTLLMNEISRELNLVIITNIGAIDCKKIDGEILDRYNAIHLYVQSQVERKNKAILMAIRNVKPYREETKHNYHK